MKRGLYSRLASRSLKSNRRFYRPYLLTGGALAAIAYILIYLSGLKILKNAQGGDFVTVVMKFGFYVIIAFSVIFLIYSHSFVMKTRNKELGLYNVLGFGKKQLSLVIFLENAYSCLIMLGGGLLFGILFSRFFELILLKIMRMKDSGEFAISLKSVLFVAGSFLAISLVISILSVKDVYFNDPAEILRESEGGEKPPRAKVLLGLIGMLLLAAAYIIALRSAKLSDASLNSFFLAVLLVIVSTYLIFIVSSVTILQGLKKNKTYYYSEKHFASLSNMACRMNRNGAGLASICVLSTIVLVLISTAAGMYFYGLRRFTNNHYRSEVVSGYYNSASDMNSHFNKEAVEKTKGLLKEYKTKPENAVETRAIALGGSLDQGKFDLLTDQKTKQNEHKTLCALYLLPLEDYEAYTGKNVNLSQDEALIYQKASSFKEKSLKLGSGLTFQIKGTADDFDIDGIYGLNADPSSEGGNQAKIYLIVPDFEHVLEKAGLTGEEKESSAIRYYWFYSFDTGLSKKKNISFTSDLYQILALQTGESGEALIVRNAREELQKATVGIGSLFFLSAMLGLIFIIAMALIMYFKQVMEGYEDRSRYEIMQKVGMTKHQIKKGIQSEMRILFFCPLLMALLHLIFAFPMIHLIVSEFTSVDRKASILVTLVCAGLYFVIYYLIYRYTSGTYYEIAGGADRRLDHREESADPTK